MALHLYKEHKLENLAGTFAGEVFSRTAPVSAVWELLRPHIAIVQTRGMAEYLQQKLAADHGIAANLEMPFVNIFLNSLLRKFYGKEFIAAEKASDQKNMRQKLMKLLSDRQFVRQQVPELEKYLCEPNTELKRWQLAGKIADLFEQYQIYRVWETDETLERSSWQKVLYRELFDARHPGRDHFFRRLLREKLTLEQQKMLPEEFSIFGISVLPPVYLDIFVRLSEYCRINFFYLSPCEEYWEYQFSNAEKRQLRAWDTAEAGNPILQALGRQGRGFFSALMSHDVISEKLYPENILQPEDYPPESSMLEIMQYDILHLFDRRANALPDGLTGIPRPDLKNDRSIVIHNCHNIRRELEVLHDELIKLVKSGIEPRDIIVMAPDIARCAPVIHAIFSNGPLRDVYSIADMAMPDNTALSETFFRLLKGASGRFEYSEIMSLLDMPLLQSVLQLPENQLASFGKILQDAGVRWGFDAAMHRKFCGADFAEYSWRNAFDRLLAGYANRPLENCCDPLLPGSIARIACLEEGEIEAFARLVDFMEKLHDLSLKIDRKYNIGQWVSIFNGMLQDFFGSDNFTATLLAPLRQALDDMQILYDENCVPGLYPLNTAAAILTDYWEEPVSCSKFLRGKITFCRMMPMRSIPMKVTALLDLNEGDFPRRVPADGFDLISASPLPGDRSPTVQDRYLLLEALMATREHLLLFYQGQNAFDNQPQTACAPLNEIADYLKNAFDLDEYKHKISGIDQTYYSMHSEFASWNKENFAALQNLRQQSAVGVQIKLPEEFSGMDLSNDIALDELIAFFTSPASWHLHNQMGLTLRTRYDDETDSEPWQLQGLAKWSVNSISIQHGVGSAQQLTDAELFRQIRSSNLLPPGEIGSESFSNQLKILKKMPARWSKYLLEAQRTAVICQHKQLACKIHGMTNMSADNRTVLSYRWGTYDSRTALPAVFGCLTAAIAFNRPVGAELLNIGSSGYEMRVIQPVSPEQALEKLSVLLKIASQNYPLPLPLFQKASPLYQTEYMAKGAFCGQDKFREYSETTDPNVKIFYSPADWDNEKFHDMFITYADLLYGMIEKSGGSGND